MITFITYEIFLQDYEESGLPRKYGWLEDEILVGQEAFDLLSSDALFELMTI